MSVKKVVIIGAGCAGLSAAYTLSKHGVDVISYEAASVAGGRCQTEWGSVTVTWWTYNVGSLHRNDFILAARTNEINH